MIKTVNLPKKVINIYDDKNRRIKTVDDDWEYVAEYDDNDNLIHFKTWFPGTGTVNEEEKYEYDENNREIYYEDCKNKITRNTKYNGNRIAAITTNMAGNTYITQYHYENGLLVKTTDDHTGNIIEKFKYDENGKLMHKNCDDIVYTYEYTRNGMIETVDCLEYGSTRIKYDENDNIISKEEFEDEKLIDGEYYYYNHNGQLVLQISDKGRVITENIYYKNGNLMCSRTVEGYDFYEYDDHNNVKFRHIIDEINNQEIHSYIEFENIYK